MKMIHKVYWTKEKTSFFWENMSRLIEKNKTSPFYRELLQIVEKYIPIKGTIIDYGCGMGYLMEELLKRRRKKKGGGIKCIGVDIARFPSQNRILPGEVIEKADTVFLIEVIEHIPVQDIANVLIEIRGMLKSGGNIVVLAHNDEEIKEIICPDCGAKFNPYGRIQSFSADKLSKLMNQNGFLKIVCQPVDLKGSLPRTIFYFLSKKKKLKLLYIGKKGN